MNSHLPLFPVAIVILALHSAPSLADEGKRFALSASYKDECGSCHVAYPPQLLSPRSWQAVIGGLAKHFGSDASLEPAKAREINDFLAANAGRSARLDASGGKGGVNLRLTETPWFQRKHRDGHDGITAAVWKSPSVRSPANCGACHRQAAEGNYSEDEIRIPGNK